MLLQSATQKAFLNIIKIIVNQKFHNNELPGEVELCEIIGVSRTSIRSALSLLESKSIILKTPKKKTVILPMQQWNWFDEDVLHILVEVMDIKELLNYICALRLSLEPQIAALCALNSNIQDLANIQSTIDMMTEACKNDDKDLWLKGDMLFHSLIIDGTHNPFFINLKTSISNCLLISIKYTTDEKLKNSTKANSEHAILLEAIRRKDALAAKNFMHTIVSNTTKKIFKENVPSYLEYI